MNLIEQRVLNSAQIIEGHIIKVDHFLNHKMDVELISEMANLFYEYFKEKEINKIITCEASGIGIAVICGLKFNVPIVFAKKNSRMDENPNNYQAKVFSYTKHLETQFNIDKRFLSKDDKVLIIDDFLANGEAMRGLINIIDQSQASIEGIGVVIEKGFQPGGDWLREKGHDLYSLCIIDEITDSRIQLRK